MNVINQVLNQLEQRGIRQDQALVRAVPQRRRLMSMLGLVVLLAAALLLANGISTLQWRQLFRPKLVAEGVIGHSEGLPVAASAIVAMPEAVKQEIVKQQAAKPEAAKPEIAKPETAKPALIKPVNKLSVLEKPSQTRPVPHKPLSQPPEPQLQAQLVPSVAQPEVKAASGIPELKHISTTQLVEADFRRATGLMQQGRSNDAIAGFEGVLRQDEHHKAARQALVALLLEAHRGVEAERVLQEGLRANPEQTGFAMQLARLLIEHGALTEAAATLEKSLAYADSLAGYQAFYAALLQRQNRHKQAIMHFQAALKLAPENGIWLMGSAISLQAAQRTDDAREAYQRALESKQLSMELQSFVQQKLKEL